MKIAITSTGDSLDSTIDPRFGRCAFFAIYDTEKQTTKFVVNSNKDVSEGAGPAVVRLIAGYKISRVISGEFGMKVKPLLEELHIETITHKETTNTIAEIVDIYKLKNGGQNA